MSWTYIVLHICNNTPSSETWKIKQFTTNSLSLDKLQWIDLGQDASKVKISVEDRTIIPSNDVTVLGVTIDKDLKLYLQACLWYMLQGSNTN